MKRAIESLFPESAINIIKLLYLLFSISNLKRNSVFAILTFLTSCNTSIPNEVKSVLKFAGNNSKELNKVIDHFRNDEDKRKLEAAFFLIANLKDQCHWEGEEKENYAKNFKEMDSIVQLGNGLLNHQWDSIQRLNGHTNLQNLKIIADVHVIKSEFLIKHINAAFKAWSYPWAKNLGFKQFCEFILPYKLKNEHPEEWMTNIQKEYSWLLDSMSGSNDPKKACILLNKNLESKFYINARFECPWDMSYSELVKTHMGKCSHATQFAEYVMRAMGIPVVMDYTPHWANKNFSHQWNGLIYKNQTIPFIGTESDPGKSKIMFTRTDWIRRKRGKIFRITYNIQEKSLLALSDNAENLPIELASTHIRDVTADYAPVSDIKIKLNDIIKNKKLAFICVFNDQKWQPVFWGIIGSFNNITFKSMERDVMYLPTYYESGGYIPAGQPVLLTKEGTSVEIIPDCNKTTDIVVRKKYPEDVSNNIRKGEAYELFYWRDEWLSLGIVKASSDSLIYNNVPEHALFLIKDINKDGQERIFTYSDDKQIWW